MVVLRQPWGRYGENAVGDADAAPDVFDELVGPAELVEDEVDDALVEHAEHDALAELGREGGYAQVHGASGNRHLDSSVLRDSLLGDVEVCKNLYARNHRQGETLGGRGHFVERAVYAVADPEYVFKGLEVYVGSLVAYSLLEYEVDEAYYRRLVRHVRGVALGIFVEIDIRDFRNEVVDARIFLPVALDYQVVHLVGIHHFERDVLVQGERKVVYDGVVEGVFGEQRYRGVGDFYRNHPVRPREIRAKLPVHLLRNVGGRNGDILVVQVRGDRLQELCLFYEAG